MDGLAGAMWKSSLETEGLAQLKVGDNDLEYFFKYREGGICSLSTFPKYFFKKKSTVFFL